ncbi:MAG: MotA/TolQ/ExbB proton channel family protein [Bacteroidota bacterium]
MDKSAPIGLLAGFGLVFGAVFMGDGASTFFDPKSLMIVVGGTFAGLLVTFTLDEVKMVPGGLKALLGFQVPDYRALADQLVDFARTARRDGPLALDAKRDEVEDEVLREGLAMAVDGASPAQANDVLKARMAEAVAPTRLMITFFNKAGTYAPAFGMVGTLIGLIQMLQNLTSPDAIGPAMAVAMITTFWGALLANLVFLPIAGKVQNQIAAILKAQQMISVGILGILREDAPTAIAQRLEAFVGGETNPEPTPLRKVA